MVTIDRLRPLVGILVSPRFLRSSRLTERRELDVIRHLQGAEKAEVTAFYFSWRDIDCEKKVVKGHVISCGQWVQETYPWPDVLYERHGNPRSSRYKEIVRLLREHSIPINSCISLSKWQCHTILNQHPHLLVYLPDTILYGEDADLLTMLEKHSKVFVKPDTGSLGVGISMLELSTDGVTLRDWRGGERSNLSVKQAAKKISRKRPTVVQQAIDLLHVGEQRADIRMTMQKNNAGIWVNSSASLRIGRSGSIVTNTHQGGGTVPLDEALCWLLGWSPPTVDRVLLELQAVTAAIVEALEGGVGPMGEIGCDMALDTAGRIWFIEANSRPIKTSKIKDYPELPLRYVQPFEYARYLYAKQTQ